MILNWHTLSISDTFKQINSTEKGLEQKEVAKRLKLYGENKLPDSQKISIYKLVFNQFKNSLVIILIIACVISFVLHEYVDGVIILIIVILNTTIGFWQELKAEEAIESLKDVNPNKSLVLRDGKQQLIDSINIVPGDVIILNSGDKVGADARLIEIANLKVNESLLTGESISESKIIDVLPADIVVADRANMVFSGTTVEQGRARAVVVTTGEDTEVGKIANLVNTEKKEPTPLQKRLDQLTKYITIFSIMVIIPIIGLSILRNNDWFEIFELAMSLAVSAVPEGLSVIVTIALAIGIKRMLKNKVLIRKLPVVEVLGSTDIICTDKTGTITTNQMTAVNFYSIDNKWDLVESEKDNEYLKNIFELFVLSSDADTQGGDPTEVALVKKAVDLGIDDSKTRKEFARLSEIPFSSEYKYMATSIKNKGTIAKGAPEEILKLCKFVIENGKRVELTKSKTEKLLKLNSEIAQEGGRVLGLATSDNEYKNLESGHMKDLTFQGLISLIDPPRNEVKAAIEKFYRAGIRVLMITGDHVLTAQAIAKKVGIKSEGALTGSDLDKLNQAELQEKVEEVSIYARVNSEHKLKILKALQQNGHIVGMGGDGVNDTPALKKADIGFSVGTGTELAKEVSDMILLDDNFANLPNAIREGRIIFQNIRNFIKLLLSANFDEILLITTSIIIGIPTALVPIQILWINLLSDGLPALALAVDDEKEDVMKKHPNSDRNALFNGLFQFIIVAGTLAYIMSFGIFSFVYPWWYGEYLSDALLDKARTMVFVSCVGFEMVVVFICRTKYFAFGKYAWKNKRLLGAVFLSLLLLAMAIYIPIFNVVFSTVPLSSSELIIVCVFVLISTSLLEIFKLVYYKDKEF